MKKKCFLLLSLFLLSNCMQSTAMLGPAVTVATSGNIYQAGLSYGTNLTIKETTGKSASEHLTNYSSKKTMEKDHPCLSYKSGAKCVKDPNCIAMSIGEDGQAYICIDKEYHSGLGIGPDPDEKCGEYIAMNFSFPGGEDGCTTWWDRENPTPNLPVEDCCTLNIDPCCMQDINPTTVPGCTNKN